MIFNPAEHVLPVGVGHVGLDRARDLARLENNQYCAENHATHGETGRITKEVDIFFRAFTINSSLGRFSFFPSITMIEPGL